MNPAHIHLLLNHFPTIGFGIGLGLLLIALLGNSDDLKRTRLSMFFIAAPLALATYAGRNDAPGAIEDSPALSPALMNAHESGALVAFAFMQATGFFAWLALWLLRRISRFPSWNLAAVLVLAIVSTALVARAASMGTEIRHVEIQSGQETSGADPGPTLARSWALFVQTTSWVWPTCETLHFIGLSMLFAVVLAVDLRMLGMGKKSLSFVALYQVLPLVMLGFGINLITGIMFFVSTPQQYVGFLFFLKMMLVVAVALNVLYFMLLNEPWTVEEGDDASKKTKLVAASAIAIWVGVLFCGHMLPFLGNSF